MKKIIFNADNFGENHDTNRAVLNGCNSGFLRSASLVATGEAYDAAVNEILPECPLLSVGVCLNIVKGFPITECSSLVDENKKFYKGLFFAIKGLVKDKQVLKDVEEEFRAQIEKVKSQVKITHITSVQKIHLIPEIFELVCKLASEYGIPYIITGREKFYFCTDIRKIINPRFFMNLIRFIIFNLYSDSDIKILKSFGLKTNDYSIGTLYSNMLDKKLLEEILEDYSQEDVLTDIQISPCSYLRDINNSHSRDFKLTQDKILEDNINRMGFDISNYK